MPAEQESQKKRKRQPNHEGCGETLPSGKKRWRGMVNGQLVSSSAKKTFTEAKAEYRELVDEILNPQPPPPPVLPRLEDYYAHLLYGRYKERVRHDQMAPSTWQLNEQMYRLNLSDSRLGALNLDEIVPSDIEKWGAALMTQGRQYKHRAIPARPMANSSKRRLMGMVESALEEARSKDKLISFNPGKDAAKPPEDEVDFRILNAEEIEELFDLCDKEDPDKTNNEREKKRRIFSNRRRRLIVHSGLHGLGAAEMAGSKGKDVDGEGVNVCRQIQRLRNLGVMERSRLKTKARKGWVAADEEFLTLLAEVGPDEYVLQTERGTAMEPANIRRTFAGMVKGTKFEGMTPYDLRHTFAMRLLEEGVDVQTAAEMMRHSVEVFLKRYVKSDRARKIAAARKLQEGRARARAKMEAKANALVA